MSHSWRYGIIAWFHYFNREMIGKQPDVFIAFATKRWAGSIELSVEKKSDDFTPG